MNRIIVLSAFFLFIGCKKEFSKGDISVISKLQSYLSKLDPTLQNEIDWNKTDKCLSTEVFYRVALKDDQNDSEFLLFKEDSIGNIEGVKFITLEVDANAMAGSLKAFDIVTKKIYQYKIDRGYLIVDRVVNNMPGSAMASVLDDDYMSTPFMVKVVPDERGGSVYQYTSLDYINIRQAYDALSQPSGTYQLVGGEKKSEYGGGTVYSSSMTGYPPVIVIDKDLYYEMNSVVDILKMIDCFNSIPDQGAVCSIELMADLPVNDHPTYLTDRRKTYAGHCFLQLRKSNQGKSIIQNIGLYPKSSLKSIATTAPIPGRFINDAWHAYNASIKISLNFVQLSTILQEIKRIGAAGPRYDIDDFNCTDFALKILNLIRPTDPLVPQTYQLPGGPATTKGTNLPQGVYRELINRIKRSPSDRKSIKISTTNLFSDASNTCK